MNYRHVYHAGNFADVLKHLILSLVVQHLQRKPAPFRVIDTHAGAGDYDLSSTEAQKTGEWREGIGRVLSADLPEDVAALMAPYLDTVRQFNLQCRTTDLRDSDALLRYPGSPVIAAELMRREDVLIANELHAEDRKELQTSLARFKNAKVLGLDGYMALKSALPPRERRGVVLIDPPFEEPGELSRLVDGLRQGVKRFATGTFLLWYPIKDPRPISAFKRQLCALGVDELMAVEFYVQAPDDVERLNGHGLAMLNAPFTLGDDLQKVLPVLVEILGQGAGASFEIARL